MKACFKTSNIDQDLVLYTGLGRNTFGATPEKLTLYKIQMTSQSETVVDIFIQANDISKKEYAERMKHLSIVNLKNVVEMNDNTDLSGELACAGGSCEVTNL